MPLSQDDWNGQLRRQAQWTRELRETLLRKIDVEGASRVLDVGCGTGVITAELADRCLGRVTGLDCDASMLDAARRTCPGAEFVEGDAHSLPFPDGAFDVAVCQFFLMWAQSPLAAVKEMARVLRPGGYAAVLAEPDYGARLDYPPDVPLQELFIQSVQARGGDPCVGRKLKYLLVEAGLRAEVGVHATVPSDLAMERDWQEAWDFSARMFEVVAQRATLEAVMARDREALEKGWRFVFSPLFWAVGRKPSA